MPETPLPRVGVRSVSEWAPLLPGVMARCLLEERGTALMLYRIEPGLRFSPHEHSSAELGVVLSGQGRLLLGSESRPVRAGDTFFVGPGTSHGFETLPDGGEAVVLNAVVPLRLDDPRPLLEAVWGRGTSPDLPGGPKPPTSKRPRRGRHAPRARDVGFPTSRS